MRYLGIDWGKSDIGLAIADGETGVASPLGTIKNDKQALQRIAEIVGRESVSTVIIGIPSHINREKVEYDAERVGKALQERLEVKVEYENEMFTTRLAQQNLIEKGIKSIKRFDDQEAARIILQSWLDKQSKK